MRFRFPARPVGTGRPEYTELDEATLISRIADIREALTDWSFRDSLLMVSGDYETDLRDRVTDSYWEAVQAMYHLANAIEETKRKETP